MAVAGRLREAMKKLVSHSEVMMDSCRSAKRKVLSASVREMLYCS
jgi:hypothetical protein